MMRKTNILFAGCASLLLAATPQVMAEGLTEITSSGDARKEIALTIYNDNLALIRELRDLDLKKGLNHIALRDVSGKIRPETAIMKFNDNATIRVLEQNFNFDLLTPNSLSEKHVGKELTVIRSNQGGGISEEKAFLLSANNGLIFKYQDRIEIGLPQDARIKFDSLPQNLRDRPTLVTNIISDTAGKRQVNIAYLSSGFSWHADYVAQLNKDNDKMSLKGWVTLKNNSGTSYENAKLQLVAGELNLVPEERKSLAYKADRVQNFNFGVSVKLEAPILDYHLYTLPQPTTLNDNQIKQVALMSVENIPVYKYYEVAQPSIRNIVNDGINAKRDHGKQLYVRAQYFFINNKQSNLGLPMPKGTFRSYKANSKGDMLLLDQKSLDHTMEDERIALKSVNIADIIAYEDITELSETKIDIGTISEGNHKITIKNLQNRVVEVLVPSSFETDWEILDENLPHKKINACRVLWKVKLKPNEQKVFNYKLRLQPTSYRSVCYSPSGF